MKKENVLLALVIMLALLNATVLFYFLRERRPPPPHDRRIVEALHFDDAKKQRFEVLKRDHREQMNALDEEFNGLLDSYFSTLSTGDVAQRDSLERSIGKIEQRRAQVTWKHFQDVKTLTGDEKLFNDFLPELIKFIVQRGPRQHPMPMPGPPEGRP